MKAFPPYLLAATGLAFSLSGCDPTTSKKEAAQAQKPVTTTDAGAAPAASSEGTAPAATTTTANPNPTSATPSARAVALPAGLKTGRWQGFLLAKNHAVHFVLEVAVEDNKAVGYLVNEGHNGQQRLRCGTVRPLGDSAIISLPGTAATLVVRANGTDHLAGAWVNPDEKKAARTAFSAIYGEQSPLRSDAATPSFAGTWRATFKGSGGRTRPATVVFEQQGAKLLGSLAGPGGSYGYLSGAALADGMGISSFDGRTSILLQAQKLPDGTLKGHFYFGKAGHEAWTAVPALPAGSPNN